jgi:hypothetical protein
MARTLSETKRLHLSCRYLHGAGRAGTAARSSPCALLGWWETCTVCDQGARFADKSLTRRRNRRDRTCGPHIARGNNRVDGPTTLGTFLPLLLAPGGSSTTQAAHPHDMSSEGHQAAAGREEAAASEHANQYASRGQTRRQCGVGTLMVESSDLCWTLVSTPTDKQQKDADAHRKAAADHRAASRALVDAEVRACGGVTAGDRDMSPFERADDIVSVVPLTPTESSAESGARSRTDTPSSSSARAVGRPGNERLQIGIAGNSGLTPFPWVPKRKVCTAAMSQSADVGAARLLRQTRP